MKKVYLVIATSLCFCFAKATNPVPNYSFENWTSGTPDNWNTNNGNSYINITQTTPGYNSMYAAQGKIALNDEGDYTQPPVLATSGTYGFPITENYNELEFYYKTKFTGGDVFVAAVVIEDASHTVIGGGVDTITTDDSAFTQKDINIIYVNGNAAASAIITFSMPDNSRDTISYFIVDDVSLNTVIAGIENIPAESKLNVYPVPAHGWLTVKGEINNLKPVQLMLIDVTGRVVIERKSATPSGNFINEELNVSGIAAGVYSLMLASDEGVLTRKVVIE